MFPPKKILCPTDFSDGSYQAIGEAGKLAEYFDAEICLVYIIPLLPATTDPDLILDSSEYQQEVRDDAEARLRTVAAPLSSKGIKIRIVMGHGDPATEIVQIAEEQNSDLLVIATHGNTGWRHLAFGSVAEKVVRFATCPVLTIRMAAQFARATSK